MGVYCETCPVRYHCKAWDEADDDNRSSYHPQNVTRADEDDCPLLKIVQPEQSTEE